MKRYKKPIVTISENRKLIFNDYGDRMLIEPAPRGSYGYSQIKDLPVRPAAKHPAPQLPPAPKPPTARDILRQNLGLDSIGKPKP